MKYIACNTSNYTKGRQRPIDTIVLHYTAGNGDTAQNNGNYFSGANRGASAHYFVDEKETVCSVREGDTAWHAGRWETNTRAIGIEMCSKKDAKGVYYIPDATVAQALALVKDIRKRYAVPFKNVIRHYDVTGKACPEPWVRNAALWQSFLERLEEKTVAENIRPDAWAQEGCDWAVKQGFFQGDEKGDFNWRGSVSRQQLAVILQRFAEKFGLA